MKMQMISIFRAVGSIPATGFSLHFFPVFSCSWSIKTIFQITVHICIQVRTTCKFTNLQVINLHYDVANNQTIAAGKDLQFTTSNS